MKRKAATTDKSADDLPKVRLITQPTFGHALREAQQTIADLDGEIVQLKLTEDTLEQTIADLDGEIVQLKLTEDTLGKQVIGLKNDLAQVGQERDELARELTEMQESESVEIQHLGAENTDLFRQILRSNIELQTLRNLLKAYDSDETTSVVPVLRNLESSNEHAVSKFQDEGQDVSTSQGQDHEIDHDDPCERESSVLRNVRVESSTTHRVLYPLDALPNDDAQKWLPQAFAYVDVDLGPAYADFLIQWINFERLHRWEKAGGRMENEERPKEITSWIREGRYPPRCKGPNLAGDFSRHFPKALRMWWAFLRSSTPLDRKGTADKNDWSALDKHGINGWFSIVVAMKWWGECLKSLTGDHLRNGTEEWLEMVAELTATLKELNKHLEE
ncbi:hypothetical protein K435DRAFT_866432 [Dendrothele bispora CBS 962.96]|uniref:Uncharacterized protein n=1 Tax=Dendrothele bispora (strain CBS 962.96) TaxID=1314807 RepID=A0A4S8LH13_DENBC|nr:hypothetical protein K435DRAFT_866423 [Dendrothele bispora CBS 962.96]THU88294.1 hypothetical protein K435DRAFT_866432 [Dendrothele bispora CBS 962.96]